MNKIYNGDLEESLNQIILSDNPKSILIVTGQNSFRKTSFETFFKKLESKINLTIYNKSQVNISYDEILNILRKFEKVNFDLIIAYGGGSVIDFVKLVSLFKKNLKSFESDFQTSNNQKKKLPIIAIPTTAGSGAESTHFAVIYKDHKKFSIINKSILPKYVILDPKTTLRLNKKQTASSGIDALCQSLESLWAKNKSETSEKYAIKSLELIYPNIIGSYFGNKENRSPMLTGSNYSGRAINISKTTGPHALSYYLTSYHDIPHGEAVAINFEPFMKINFDSIKDELKIRLFEIFNVNSLNQLINCFILLKKTLGLKSDLSEIRNLNIEEYYNNINIERLKNNPVNLSKKSLIRIIKRHL